MVAVFGASCKARKAATAHCYFRAFLSWGVFGYPIYLLILICAEFVFLQPGGGCSSFTNERRMEAWKIRAHSSSESRFFEDLRSLQILLRGKHAPMESITQLVSRHLRSLFSVEIVFPFDDSFYFYSLSGVAETYWYDITSRKLSCASKCDVLIQI